MARVLLFGRLADAAGWRERDVPYEGALSGLRRRLAASGPELLAIDAPGVQVAIDQAIVRGDPHISPVAEVAFLPPFSGG